MVLSGDEVSLASDRSKKEVVAHHHGSRVKLEPRVQEVHRSELAKGSEAEVEEVDDVDSQHRDEVELNLGDS